MDIETIQISLENGCVPGIQKEILSCLKRLPEQ